MIKFILLNDLYLFYKKTVFCVKHTFMALRTGKALPEQRFLV